MMLEIVGSAALATLVLAIAVQACMRVLRIRHPELLLTAWTAVLVASLAMPALQYVRPPFAAATLSVPMPLGRTADPRSPYGPGLALKARERDGVATAARAPDRSWGWPGWSWRAWLTTAYLAGAGVLLLRLSLGLILSLRLRQTARPVEGDWGAGRIKLRSSSRVQAPVTVGATVLLPADHLNWTNEEYAAVLAHERAHAARGDFYIQLLSQLNRSLFWFSPISWWLHERLVTLAEMNSDDAAIEALGDRAGYATILLDIARRGTPPSPAIAMARPRTMSRRVDRILLEDGVPSRVRPGKQGALAAGVAPLAVLAAIVNAGAASVDAGASSPPDMSRLAAQRAPHKRITIDPKLLDAYAGAYRDPKTGSVMIVTRDGDHLRTGRVGGWPPVPEYPYTDHDFFITAAPRQNSFVTNASGAVVAVVHHEQGRDEVLDRLSPDAARQEETARTGRLAAELAPRTAIKIDPHVLDADAGAYQLGPNEVFTVSRDGDRLRVKLTGQDAYEVHPYSNRDFFYTVTPAQLTFVPGPDGKATALVLHKDGTDRTAPRVDASVAAALDQKLANELAPHTAIAVDPALLDRYVGRYRNADLEMTVTREGDRLVVRATGFPAYPIFPYTQRDFFATKGPVQISFAANGTGKATQLIRHRLALDTVLAREE